MLIGLKALWRTVSVDRVSETDIEQYLKNGLCGSTTCMLSYIIFSYIVNTLHIVTAHKIDHVNA